MKYFNRQFGIGKSKYIINFHDGEKKHKDGSNFFDIAIFSKDDSFLFVGNIVFNGRLLSYKKTSNIDGWIEAIENLGL